jgi:hypothetical protein
MCVLVSAASQLLSCLLSFGVSFHSNTQRELFRVVRLSHSTFEFYSRASNSILMKSCYSAPLQSMAGRGVMLLQSQILAAPFYLILMIESYLNTIMTSLGRLCALMYTGRLCAARSCKRLTIARSFALYRQGL